MTYYNPHNKPVYYRVVYLIKRHKTISGVCACLFVFLLIYLLNNRNNLVYLSDNVSIPYEYLRRSEPFMNMNIPRGNLIL